MSRRRQVAAAAIILSELGGVKKQRRKRSIWSKGWLVNRQRFSHINLLNFIRDDSRNDYRNYLRMSAENFNVLLDKVKPFIAKRDTVLRKAITAEERLIATLRFLATGRSFEDLKLICGTHL